MLAGIGENAGVIDIGQGYAVTFKVESHNHPSYVEPYQGAATGVGGIVRDILAMGARPVAVMDPLRFGPLDADDTHRVLPGIVAGVGGYGNCLGLPNIGGEAVFDATLPRQPAGQRALRRRAAPRGPAPGQGDRRRQPGDPVRRHAPAATASAASRCWRRETFDADGPAKRPSVQVGDPFMEKLLIECTLELFAAGAGRRHPGPRRRRASPARPPSWPSAGDGGMHVELDRVPAARLHARARGDPDERVAGADDGGRRARRRRRRSWRSARSGTSRRPSSARSPTPAGCRSTGTASASSTYPRGRSRTTGRPTSARSPARTGRTRCRPTRAEALPRPDDRRRAARRPCCGWSRRPNLCDKSWITDQYDRYVRGNTVLAQPEDSGMIRVDEETNLGVAVSTDCNGRFAMLDPYAGAQLALAESYRNVATGGAVPLAISDCLNFGSPEDPAVMWQFAEACRGLKDGCLELGIPVTGGNVSLYNQTGETAILPTPVVAVLGVIDDVTRRTPIGFVGRRRAGLPARRDPRGAVRLGVGARRARPPRRAAAGGRPRRRAGAGRAAARRRRPAHLGARPVRRRPGPGAGRVGAAPRRRRHGRRARRRPVRRAVHRVRRPGAGDRARRRRRAAGRARAGARRTASPRSASPAATRSPSTGSSTSRSTSCGRPGPTPCRPRSAEDRRGYPVHRVSLSFSGSAAHENLRKCPRSPGVGRRPRVPNHCRAPSYPPGCRPAAHRA